jgi:hypothetical protein
MPGPDKHEEAKFRFNFSFLAKYKWFAVIFSKQMRSIYPETYDNVLAFGVLIICIFLYFWRLYGFKVSYLYLKPANTKPLITKQIVGQQNLTMEDLNFIYENNDEYELDIPLLKEVEEFRIKNKFNLKLKK